MDGNETDWYHNALHPGIFSSWFNLHTSTALDIAICAQKKWIPLADFSHGLLAGVALMQTIVVSKKNTFE